MPTTLTSPAAETPPLIPFSVQSAGNTQLLSTAEKIQAGSIRQQVNKIIDSSIAKPGGHSRTVLTNLLHLTPEYLKSQGVDRPLVVYNSHGEREYKSDAANYEDAIVMVRGGTYGQSFDLVAPPEGFSAEESIGIPKEQAANWGTDNAYRTAMIYPDHNAFYRALNVASEYKTNSEFRSDVLALDPEKGPSRDIEVDKEIRGRHTEVRQNIASWLRGLDSGKSKVLTAISREPQAPRSQVVTKPNAPVADEEIKMALTHIKRSVEYKTKADSAVMKALFPMHDDQGVPSLMKRYRNDPDNGILPEMSIRINDDDSVDVIWGSNKAVDNPYVSKQVQKFEGLASSNEASKANSGNNKLRGERVAQFKGENAPLRAFFAMRSAGAEYGQTDVTAGPATDANQARAKIEEFAGNFDARLEKSFLASKLMAYTLDDPEMVKSINRHYANAVIPSDVQPFGDPKEDPGKLFVGERTIPLKNFFQAAEFRAMEQPYANYLEIIKNKSLAVLPEGPPLNYAIVGGGASAAYAAVELAKIARESKREINVNVFEAAPERNLTGRLHSYVSKLGPNSEHGAMRFPFSSTLFMDKVREVLGDEAAAVTFPNHHVTSSMFILDDLHGSRGKHINGINDGTFDKEVAPMIDYVNKQFEAISVVVDGRTVTYKEMEQFLLERPEIRSASEADVMQKAWIQINIEHNITFAAFVEQAVRKGFESGEMPVPEKFKKIFDEKDDKTASAMVAKQLLVHKEMSKFLDVGKGTGGWGAYARMSVSQELITRSINSTEEYMFPDLKKGNQELGRFWRDFAREVGGKDFTLNWQTGNMVVGMAKEPADPIGSAMPQAWLKTRDVSEETGDAVNDEYIKSYDGVLTTSHPTVLHKVTAPQMNSSEEKVRLSGLDENGNRVDQLLDKPFRILSKPNAELAKTGLDVNNELVKRWSREATAFGTTKVQFLVPKEIFLQVAPRDPYFPTSSHQTTSNVPAKWALIDTERKPEFVNSTEAIPVGGNLPEEAQIIDGDKTYEWMKISQHKFDSLDENDPARSGGKQLRQNGGDWVPIPVTRLSEFDVDDETLHNIYGAGGNAVTVIDDQKVIWAPVTHEQLAAINDDDPIRSWIEKPVLKHQEAESYVVDRTWLEKNDPKSPLLDIKAENFMPITTRSGEPGFYYNVPVDKVKDFEQAVKSEGLTEIKNIQDIPELEKFEEIYKINNEGEVPKAYQFIGGTRNLYIFVGENWATIVSYDWDKEGDKILANSRFTDDTSSQPVEDLGHANRFEVGDAENPISQLQRHAVEPSTMNFRQKKTLLAAFSMLGVNDGINKQPVTNLYKNSLNYKYNPKTYSPPTILPAGENAGQNPGWIDDTFRNTAPQVTALAIMAGGELSDNVPELYMNKPPLIGDSQLPPYASFGLPSHETARAR